MIRKTLSRISACAVLVGGLVASAPGQGSELNKPAGPAAQLVRRAVILAESEQPFAALGVLRKALRISPNYLEAHVEYWNIRTNYLAEYDAVEGEYQLLVRRFPHNPVYLMALNRAHGFRDRGALTEVVHLAPEWAWAHYAKALLVKDSDPQLAAQELQRCIDLDARAIEAYELLINIQEQRLHKIDEAIKTAETFAAQVHVRPTMRLSELWRLRLVKANQSESAKDALRNELARLAAQTKEVDVLIAIRSAYVNLLADSDAACVVEGVIHRIDPSWSQWRGWVYSEVRFNQSKVPRYVVLVNRQIKIRDDVQQIVGAVEKSSSERIDLLERLLNQRPNPSVRRIIFENIFRLAYRSNDSESVRRYGAALFRMDRSDAALAAQIALVLASERQEFKTAMYFAREAYNLTSEFQPAERPKNTPQETFESLFPVEKQRQAFEKNRALALDAYGWMLVKSGRADKGEPLLRAAVKLDRTADGLWHLAKAVEKLGRGEEAAILETESSRFLGESVRHKFTDEAAPPLRMSTIGRQLITLSDLTGKVVILNFWATWCVPCIQEMPSLTKLYEKYKMRGLDILAVSTDEDPKRVPPFVKEKRLPFLVLYDDSFSKRLKVDALPTNIFLDQKGRIRYRKTGFEEGDERELEAVILELLN